MLQMTDKGAGDRQQGAVRSETNWRGDWKGQVLQKTGCWSSSTVGQVCPQQPLV